MGSTSNCVFDPNFPDRWTPETNWNKILFAGDKELQSAELIEIQSMLSGNNKEGWDSLYRNGSIIKGLVSTVVGLGASPTVSFSEGIIYVEGRFLYVPASLPLAINGIGIENVVLNITKNVIDETNDSNLRNPLTGGALYGQPGASREIWQGNLAVSPNPSSSAVIDGYLVKSFRDGQLIPPYTLEDKILDRVTNVLAQRTFEESGNYCIEGLQVTTQSILVPSGINNIPTQRVGVEKGKAYVSGYRIENRAKTFIDIVEPTNANNINNAQYSLNLIDAQHTQEFVATAGGTFLGTDIGKVLRISIANVVATQLSPVIINYTIRTGDTLSNVLTKLDIYLSSDPNNTLLTNLPTNFNITQVGSTTLQARQFLYTYLYFIKVTNTSLKVGFKNSNATTASPTITFGIFASNLVTVSTFINVTIPIITEQVFSSGQGYPTITVPFVPIKEVSQVNIDYRMYREAVLRGSVPGTRDTLVQPTAFLIESIVDVLGNVYQSGRDYTVTSNQIDWSPSGSGAIEPSSSGLYYVTYLYSEQLIPVSEYRITNRSSITFVQKQPAPGRQVRLSFSYFLKRTDVICLDKTGNLVITFGVESSLASAPIPSADLLPLANIEMVNSEPARLYPLACRRYTMTDIQKLEDRVTNTEFLIAVQQLDNEAMDKAPVIGIDLKGSYNDNFINLNKADLTNPSFSAAIYPPLLGIRPSFNLIQFDLASSINVSTASVGLIRHMPDQNNVSALWKAVLPYTHQVIISQTRKTGFYNLQPHNVLTRAAMIMLQPGVDNASELATNTQTVVIPVLQPDLDISGASSNQALQDAKTAVNALNLDASSQVSVANRLVQQVVNNSSITSRLGDTLTQLPSLKQRTIRITGELFKPNDNTLELYFNNVLVLEDGGPNISPVPGKYKRISNTSNGNAPNKFSATLDGTIDLLFTIPANTPVGDHELLVKNNSNDARATYKGNNVIINQNYLTTITQVKYNITKVSIAEQDIWDAGHGALQRLQTIKGVCIGDPLAQTFSLPNAQMLTGVNLRFRSKSIETSDNYVLVQLRNVINGYPGTDVLTQTRLKPSDITVSNNGSAVTRALFDIPFIIQPQPQEYCIVMYSPSNQYELYTATLGERDFLDNTTIGEQAYLNGVFFTSSNNTTWSAVQNTDLTFELLAARFSATSGEIDLGTATSNAITSFALNVSSVLPETTEINYFYSLDNGTTYFKFDPNIVTSVPLANPNTQATIGNVTNVRFKAVFSGTDRISPMLGLDTITASLYSNNTAGSWISKSVDYQQVYNTVSIILQRIRPNGTTVTLSVSADEGSTWQIIPETSSKLIDGNINLEEVTYSLLNLPQNISVNNTLVARTKFKWKVDFTSSNNKIMPLIKRVITLSHLE
jgi:Domain of unknown function (DUF4815)